MKRTLLRNVSHLARNHLFSPRTPNSTPNPSLLPLATSPRSRIGFRLFSSDNDSSNQNPNPEPTTELTQPEKKDVSIEVQDVGNKGNPIRFQLVLSGKAVWLL